MNLPPEIIQIIFLNLCPLKTIFPLQNDTRLLLTRICSQWRAIALGMPDLWANLRIPINLTPPHDHIRAWISRSAPSALSVTFYCPLHLGTFSAEIFDLIVPAIQRCAFLNLRIDEPTIKRLLTLPTGSLCTLRSISITPTRTGFSRSLHSIPRVTAFQQCPQLRRVSLELIGHAVDPAIYELPWPQLTHLSIGSCREYETLNVLQQCTVLQECNISTFPNDPPDVLRIAELAFRPIVLPSLHTLRLGLGDPAGHSIHFVHALRLPRLRSFRLATGMMSWNPLPLLPLFLPLLSETVRDLDLSRWIATDLLAALALVPNLEALTSWDNSAEVLRALGDDAIVPRLVILTLGAVIPDVLFDVLEARVAAAHAVGGIAALTDISVDPGDEDIDTARLAALRAAGVRLVFRN